MLKKSRLKVVASKEVNRTVVPRRLKSKDYRPREYLEREEVERLRDAARGNRHGVRDALMIDMAYLHGFRASELVGLQWSQVSLESKTLLTNRGKDGENNNHRLDRGELTALRELRKENPDGQFVFVSERGKRFGPAGFAKMVERAGKAAKLPFSVHPHMLRHACGFNLAATGADTRAIQGYLGHRSIKSTERYTALSPDRLKGFAERLRGR
jgi:integrase